ncbi:SARG protein, partial [Cochlearius cochlearius]|nr:SARG protein [Cochlearius cochlearius]
MPRKELGLGMAGCGSGSCDSMVSTASNHSQRSDNSYDYLSAEEKECLMFLEETIGSLDAEADSGVSTDGTDYVEPSKLPGTWPETDSVPQGKLQSRAPAFFAKGLSGWGAFPWQAGEERCPSFTRVVNSRVQVLCHGCPGLAGMKESCKQEGVLCPSAERCMTSHLSLCLDLENGAPPPSAGQQHAAEQKGGKSISAFSSSAPAAVPSPGYYSLPRSITVANTQRANGASDGKVTVRTVEDPVPVRKSSWKMAKEDRLDQANARSQIKPLGSLITQPPDPFQDDLVNNVWSRSNRSDAKRGTAKETKTWTSWGQPEKSTLEEAPHDPDAKRGPPTAPKPRKLPPNIILKTSKNSPVLLTTEFGQKVKALPPSSAGSQPSSASDATAEKANSGHLDPKGREKARREALEKLGLSQDRREPSTHLQPTIHPQPREMALPVPGEPKACCGAAERSVPGIRQMNFKSNTLERSGVGLSSYMTSTKEQSIKTSSSLGKMSFIERLAPSFLRSSRPRPGKDFAGLKEPGQVEQKSSKQQSYPLQNFPRPPRSCVSVKISPKGTTDENRREALKKLGLLKE